MSADGTGRGSAADQIRLLRSLPEDDPQRQQLRDQLAEQHMPLVIYLARRYSGRSEPLQDLIQVGAIGLLKAIDRYDPERGFEFGTYATPTILGEIKRHFRDNSWLIRVPRAAQELQSTLNAARESLTQELQRAPTVAELAERVDAEPEAVLEALDVARVYSSPSLDALTEPGELGREHPMLGITDAGFEQIEQRQLLRAAIERLPELEQEVLALRFTMNKKQTEIAAIVGISQMQVSRLLARALRELRESLGATAPPG